MFVLAPVIEVADPSATYVAMLRRDPCSYCGRPCEHIDHVVASARGGENAWTNLTAACARCNGRKQHDSLLAFLAGYRDAPSPRRRRVRADDLREYLNRYLDAEMSKPLRVLVWTNGSRRPSAVLRTPRRYGFHRIDRAVALAVMRLSANGPTGPVMTLDIPRLCSTVGRCGPGAERAVAESIDRLCRIPVSFKGVLGAARILTILPHPEGGAHLQIHPALVAAFHDTTIAIRDRLSAPSPGTSIPSTLVAATAEVSRLAKLSCGERRAEAAAYARAHPVPRPHGRRGRRRRPIRQRRSGRSRTS